MMASWINTLGGNEKDISFRQQWNMQLFESMCFPNDTDCFCLLNNLFPPIAHIVLCSGTKCFNRMKHIAGKYVTEGSKERMYQLV